MLTSFAYRLEENLGKIVVATTRVEAMLGDTTSVFTQKMKDILSSMRSLLFTLSIEGGYRLFVMQNLRDLILGPVL